MFRSADREKHSKPCAALHTAKGAEVPQAPDIWHNFKGLIGGKSGEVDCMREQSLPNPWAGGHKQSGGGHVLRVSGHKKMGLCLQQYQAFRVWRRLKG